MRFANNLGCVSLLTLLLAVPGARGQPAAASATAMEVPSNMKSYFVGFLVDGPKAGATDRTELEKLQQSHLKFLRVQIEARRILIAGPLLDEGRVHGLAVIVAASLKEAEAAVAQDPMVLSGRMKYEIHPGMLPDLSAVRVEYGSLKRR